MNEAYEKHLDLFDDDFEMTTAAARIIGRKMNLFLSIKWNYPNNMHSWKKLILRKAKANHYGSLSLPWIWRNLLQKSENFKSDKNKGIVEGTLKNDF